MKNDGLDDLDTAETFVYCDVCTELLATVNCWKCGLVLCMSCRATLPEHPCGWIEAVANIRYEPCPCSECKKGDLNAR